MSWWRRRTPPPVDPQTVRLVATVYFALSMRGRDEGELGFITGLLGSLQMDPPNRADIDRIIQRIAHERADR